MDEQRIEAAAKAMYDAVLAGAGTADDFNSRPPEVRAIWLSAARAASPHLAPDDGVADVAEQLLIRAANDIGESQMAEPSYSNEGNRRIRHPDSAPSPAKQPLAPATDGEEEVVERMCKAYDDCTECRPNFHYSSMTDALHVANEARDAKWAAWGIIEVAVRNPSVAEYMKHWEERALKAEEELAIRSRLTQPRSAEERVTVFTQGCGCCFVVSQDGIAQKQFTGGDPASRLAEIYADGLRARLDGK